jgi:transcriptional regulator with XRE-family HTH domain
MTLGDRVKQRRRHLRMTQQGLAERAGVLRGTIADLERNIRYVVGSDTLKRLAQALGCTTDYLVGMHDEESEYVPTRLALVGS